ncbi:MAG TPA: hypothetical protein VJY54_09525 [Lachnospiraceae bacterium]|nr:hypothetical protein [Lachnospiraceae bacterium]
MELYPRLYIGKMVNNPDKLLHKLKKQSKVLQFYVIILSRNPSDQLEIYKACYLSQKYFKKNPIYVIGIASDYDEAVDIIKQIAEECYLHSGNCNLKEYLFCEETLNKGSNQEKKPIEG